MRVLLGGLDLNFQNQENRLMLPDGVCPISASLAGTRLSTFENEPV